MSWNVIKILLANQKNDDECRKKKESDVDSIAGVTPKLSQLFVTTTQEEKITNNATDRK